MQLKALVERFAADRSGTIGIVFALAILPILMATGAAVDYSNSARVRSKLADALDSGALAAAKAYAMGTTDEAELTRLARAYVDGNLSASEQALGTITAFKVTADADQGAVRVAATMVVPTYMLELAGVDELPVTEQAVARAASKNVELVLMLDVTGSMGGSKISNLRTAAEDLVDILIPEKKKTDKVKIGVVPYSQGVNAGAYAKKATKGKSDKCATERVGDKAYTDELFDAEAIGTGSAFCPPNVIQPLTTNRNVLATEISKLDAGGMTAGQTGIAWSWYMLSPTWASLWPGDSAPAAYDTKDLMKIVVLMTDGQFNTFYDLKKSKGGESGGEEEAPDYAEYYDAATPDDRAKSLCDAMKTAPHNIIIYTVGFQAPSGAKTLLKYCASSSDNYFDASSGTELKSAFAAIANDVQALRLTE
ncbi:MAG: pilus assembly protein [Hyphomicrobiales bacterium]